MSILLNRYTLRPRDICIAIFGLLCVTPGPVPKCAYAIVFVVVGIESLFAIGFTPGKDKAFIPVIGALSK